MPRVSVVVVPADTLAVLDKEVEARSAPMLAATKGASYTRRWPPLSEGFTRCAE
jgi:hypothetical protein